MDGKGEYLTMDESDPLTACIFGAEMFREFFVESMIAATELDQSEALMDLLVGTNSIGWHSYALEYKLTHFEYNDTFDHTDDEVHCTLLPYVEYTGAQNDCDDALAMVVGGLSVRFLMHRIASSSDSITYQLDIKMADEFEFNGNYSDAEDKGYDTSTDELINLVGQLLDKGLIDSFSWHTEVSFQITVPNTCDHSYQSYRWEYNGTDLESVTSNGNNANPLIRIQTEKSDGTLADPYYNTAETIILRHDLSWTVEFRMKGTKGFIMSSGTSYATGNAPYFLKTHDHVFGGHYYKYVETDPETGEEKTKGGRKQYGVEFTKYGYSKTDVHTYYVENRIASDGSNMPWLYVDGEELGPMNNFFLNHESVNYDQETVVDWFNGTDISINYIFNSNFPFASDITMEYIQIQENTDSSSAWVDDGTVSATCTTPGGEVKRCNLCGAEEIQQTSAALGHNDVVISGYAATCTQDGLSDGAQCSVCNEILGAQQVVPAAGHTETVISGSAATCTADGLTDGAKCSVCGEILTAQGSIPATGHTEETVLGTSATCNTEGLTDGKKCSVCGEITAEQTVIPLSDHIYTVEVTTAPTATSEGIRTYTCTVCGHSYTDVLPKSGMVRLSGNNRYDTAIAVADYLKTELGVEQFENIVVASGTGFADALAGSYLAVRKNAPILLVNKNTTADVADYIEANLAEGGTVYLLGGEAAVPAAMEEELAGLNVERLAGANRYETNLLILAKAGFAGEEILVCTGNGFADSLSASAVGKPILLVNKSLNADQLEFVESTSGEFVIIGGESAVSAAVEETLTGYGTVERLAGDNRYETSVLVAEYFFDAPTSAVVAYSQNFPDGLCGGPLAAATNSPLLLMATNRGDNVIEYAQEAGISCGAVLGGIGLIDDATAKNVFSMK